MLKHEYTVAKSAWYLVTDLTGIFYADSRKSVSKFSGSLSLKIYTIERDLEKQTKVAKIRIKT